MTMRFRWIYDDRVYARPCPCPCPRPFANAIHLNLRQICESVKRMAWKRPKKWVWELDRKYMAWQQSAHTLTNTLCEEKMVDNEVAIVMVCNGLMTSSKDLQQLSCYSKLLLEGKRNRIRRTCRCVKCTIFARHSNCAHRNSKLARGHHHLNRQQSTAIGVNFQVTSTFTHDNFDFAVVHVRLCIVLTTLALSHRTIELHTSTSIALL